MHDAALCTHWPRLLGERTYKIEFEFERRPGIALSNCRKNRAAKRRVEQRRGEAAMHRANWIVVVEFRHTLEYGASLFDFNQVKAHELADRRIRHRAGDDCFQEAKAVVGFENFGRDDAVGLAAHNAPRFVPVSMHGLVVTVNLLGRGWSSAVLIPL